MSERMVFIDAHAHLLREPQDLDAVVESGVLEQAWLMEAPYYQPCTKSVLRDLAPRADFLDVAQRYPGFFVPFGFIDFTAGPEQVDQMKDMGFVGLKAIRPPMPYDHPGYLPIYERADALRMPILFHVGIIMKNKPKEMTPAQSLGPTNMRPSMLEAIAMAFPDLPVIAGHMGMPWLDELFELLYYHPNTYCTLCGAIDYKWLIDNLDKRCNREFPGEPTFVERMMFASDTCYGRPEFHEHPLKFAQFMEGFFRYVGSRWHSWGDRAADVFHGTARKVIGG